MEVSDYFELRALHAALVVAKFPHLGPRRELYGSPFLAKIANAALDELIKSEVERGLSSELDWQAWRTIDPTRQEFLLVRTQVNENSLWNQWSVMERNTYLDYLASPYVLSEAARTALLVDIRPTPS